jgi:hypothetical protein
MPAPDLSAKEFVIKVMMKGIFSALGITKRIISDRDIYINCLGTYSGRNF